MAVREQSVLIWAVWVHYVSFSILYFLVKHTFTFHCRLCILGLLVSPFLLNPPPPRPGGPGLLVWGSVGLVGRGFLPSPCRHAFDPPQQHCLVGCLPHSAQVWLCVFEEGGGVAVCRGGGGSGIFVPKLMHCLHAHCPRGNHSPASTEIWRVLPNTDTQYHRALHFQPFCPWCCWWSAPPVPLNRPLEILHLCWGYLGQIARVLGRGVWKRTWKGQRRRSLISGFWGYGPVLVCNRHSQRQGTRE